MFFLYLSILFKIFPRWMNFSKIGTYVVRFLKYKNNSDGYFYNNKLFCLFKDSYSFFPFLLVFIGYNQPAHRTNIQTRRANKR